MLKPIYILGDSLQEESYNSFIDYLFSVSNIFSYEILKLPDNIHDIDDKKYCGVISKTEKIFQNFYIKKNVDKKNTLKSFVYFNNSYVKDYLKKARSIYIWDYPNGIENLCFYKDDKCIFESITHEDIFIFYPENTVEIEIVKKTGVLFI